MRKLSRRANVDPGVARSEPHCGVPEGVREWGDLGREAVPENFHRHFRHLDLGACK